MSTISSFWLDAELRDSRIAMWHNISRDGIVKIGGFGGTKKEYQREQNLIHKRDVKLPKNK